MAQQPRKEGVIRPYLEAALASVSAPEILDLFCSDGYYGFLAQSLAKGSALTGVDLNGEDIQRCRAMARHLVLGRAEFHEQDVQNFVQTSTPYDIVLCVGGLYHLSDPANLLKGLRRIVRGYAIIQSAVTADDTGPDLLVAPNPWFRTWGALFSHSYLQARTLESGFEIIASDFNVRAEPNPNRVASSYILAR